MASPQFPEPVKYFAAILWADLATLQQALALLEEKFGPLDYMGPDYSFDVSNYYEAEMGPNLRRRLISFRNLEMPNKLPDYKILTNAIEMRLAKEGSRLVNVDIGYLDDNKVVLASCKKAGQKIYLTAGIWADMIARYKQGRYQPFEWSFLDFKDGRYDEDLLKIRALYMQQLRQWRKQREGETSASQSDHDRT
jgi:hypothetical protein